VAVIVTELGLGGVGGAVYVAESAVTFPPVDCVVTSPPYFALRNYGVPGQLGLEGVVLLLQLGYLGAAAAAAEPAGDVAPDVLDGAE